MHYINVQHLVRLYAVLTCCGFGLPSYLHRCGAIKCSNIFDTPTSIPTEGIYSPLRISSAAFPISSKPSLSTIRDTMRDVYLVWVKYLSFLMSVTFSTPYFVTNSRYLLFSSGAIMFDSPTLKRSVPFILCILVHEDHIFPCSSIAFKALSAFIFPALALAIARSVIKHSSFFTILHNSHILIIAWLYVVSCFLELNVSSPCEPYLLLLSQNCLCTTLNFRSQQEISALSSIFRRACVIYGLHSILLLCNVRHRFPACYVPWILIKTISS